MRARERKRERENKRKPGTWNTFPNAAIRSREHDRQADLANSAKRVEAASSNCIGSASIEITELSRAICLRLYINRAQSRNIVTYRERVFRMRRNYLRCLRSRSFRSGSASCRLAMERLRRVIRSFREYRRR